MVPTLGGAAIFGVAVHVVHEPHPIGLQMDAFPGISGLVSLNLGGRGRSFHVNGVLVDFDLTSLAADQAVLLSYIDGIARTFVDTMGRTWSNVLMPGPVRFFPDGPKPTPTGWCLPYSLTLTGLS